MGQCQFQTTPQNITLHLKDLFAEGEIAEEATEIPALHWPKFATGGETSSRSMV